MLRSGGASLSRALVKRLLAAGWACAFKPIRAVAMRRESAGGGVTELQAQADALARYIDLSHTYFDNVAGFDDLPRIAHKLVA